MRTENVAGKKSWVVKTPRINAAVTVQGAMMAPVKFRLPDGRDATPYYVSPWQDEDTSKIEPPVLQPLRGDFFCCPFGADNKVGDEDHLPHGEAASKDWTFRSCEDQGDHTSLSLQMRYNACPGEITREMLYGRDDPHVISRTTLEGFSGRYPLGYHANLQGGREGEWKLYTDAIDLGITCPDYTAPMIEGEYFALAPDVRFSTLEEVPSRWKDPDKVDCSIFPSRWGFIDLFAIYRKRSPEAPLAERLAWTVAVNRLEKYLWYTIKDAAVLPTTVFWWENGGRHMAPWSGRNSCLGIEETCTYFANGRRLSLEPNVVSDAGIPTAVSLDPAAPRMIWSLQGVLPLEDTDTPITGMSLNAQGQPAFRDGTGRELTIPVRIADFL